MRKKFFLAFCLCAVSIIFFVDKVSAYNFSPRAAFVMTKDGIRHYVLDDRIDKSDFDPENIFELYLGEAPVSKKSDTMEVYRLRFYRENSVWYFRIDEYYGNLPIKGTKYELIFNFCRNRYF